MRIEVFHISALLISIPSQLSELAPTKDALLKAKEDWLRILN
jgi:hypothetical protein